MKLFRIDLNKKAIQVDVRPSRIPLVFAVPFDDFCSPRGANRASLDIAHHVAESLNIKPLFIDSKYAAVAKFLSQSSKTLVAGINLPYIVFDDCDDRARLLTIGANTYDQGEFVNQCDLVLNPCFNRVKFEGGAFERSPDAPFTQVVIDYDCMPTRIRPDIATFDPYQFEPTAALARPVPPKTIAVYIRMPKWESRPQFFAKMREFHEKYGCQFLITTGPATNHETAKEVRDCVKEMPGSECFIYNRDDLALNPFEDYLRRADLIVVTSDTVSTASDALAKNKAVLLQADDERRDLLLSNMDTDTDPSGHVEVDIKNYIFQLSLMKSDRLRLFTEENLLSGWRPKPKEEWRVIGDQIADNIRERIEYIRLAERSSRVRFSRRSTRVEEPVGVY